MEPFRIHFQEQQLDDLRRRLASTRRPQPWSSAGWNFGTDANYLASLLDYWGHSYNWQQRVAEWNRYP